MKAIYFILSVGADFDPSLPIDEDGIGATPLILPWEVKGTIYEVEGETPDVIETERQLRKFVQDMAEGSDEGDVALVKMTKTDVTTLDHHSGYYQPPWD